MTTLINTSQLYMYRLHINLPKLAQLMKKRGMSPYINDLGYAVHSLLKELWAEFSPHQFFIERVDQTHLIALAYGYYPFDKMQFQVSLFADPMLASTVDWNLSAGKLMPLEWPENSKIGFCVTACPIQRTRRHTNFHESKREKVGSMYELDVYQYYLENKALDEDILTREQVYLQWFKEQFERFRAASLISLSLKSYQRVRLQRRMKDRQFCSKFLERPFAVFEGVFEIKNASNFTQMLSRGIGRHRAFGYGMILMKKASQYLES